MHLLLTRQLDDCSDLIVRFKELGHIVSHLPLLNIEKVQYNQKSLKGCNGIIFTSANAIKFLDTKQSEAKFKQSIVTIFFVVISAYIHPAFGVFFL